jgi:hypothetical protein
LKERSIGSERTSLASSCRARPSRKARSFDTPATPQANEKLAQQVASLTAQLESARAQVIEVSNNALLSASGQVALSAVRETVKDNGVQGGGRKS